MSIRIAYILGLSYSGSTLLDLLLLSHKDAASGGELDTLFQFRDVYDRCVCDEAWPYDHWQAVDRIVKSKIGKSLFEIDTGTRDPATFATYNTAILQAVQEVSGAQVIVDSSKNARRLRWHTELGLMDRLTISALTT